MAYPEKILADDERVVEHLHPHWITLVPATLWFIVICAAGGFSIKLAQDHSDGGGDWRDCRRVRRLPSSGGYRLNQSRQAEHSISWTKR